MDAGIVGGRINEPFLDAFFVAHAAVGALLALAGLRFLPLLGLAVAWEIAERILKPLVPAAFIHPSQDSLANVAGDLLAAALGWLAAHALLASARRGEKGTGRRSPRSPLLGQGTQGS